MINGNEYFRDDLKDYSQFPWPGRIFQKFPDFSRLVDTLVNRLPVGRPSERLCDMRMTYIYNLAIGISPQKVKSAKVAVIYKNEDRNVLTYMPISILPLFSKKHEKKLFMLHFFLQMFHYNTITIWF